jgi:uncharacterized protein (DUF1697 family)
MSRRVQRYAAFLRGVSPMNCSMPALKQCLEAEGFDNVKTLLSSGNAVFDAPAQDEAALAARCEAAMQRHLGRGFATLVRAQAQLWDMIHTDPYQAFELPPGAKRVVTFLSQPPAQEPALPIERDDAAILCVWNTEAYSIYVPHPGSPTFMVLLEKTFGTRITTRTWDTVQKVAAA